MWSNFQRVENSVNVLELKKNTFHNVLVCHNDFLLVRRIRLSMYRINKHMISLRIYNKPIIHNPSSTRRNKIPVNYKSVSYICLCLCVIAFTVKIQKEKQCYPLQTWSLRKYVSDVTSTVPLALVIHLPCLANEHGVQSCTPPFCVCVCTFFT